MKKTITKIVRMFKKKKNGEISELTKSKSYFKIEKETPLDSGIPSKKESVSPSVPRVKDIQPRMSADEISKKTDELIKKGDEVLARKKMDENTEEKNGDSPLYYVKSDNYYLMYKNNRAFIMSVSDRFWKVIKYPCVVWKSEFYDITREEFNKIIKDRPKISEIKRYLYIYVPDDWDFKNEKEIKEYIKMNELADYSKAIKI